jgi:hypothetical protein
MGALVPMCTKHFPLFMSNYKSNERRQGCSTKLSRSRRAPLPSCLPYRSPGPPPAGPRVESLLRCSPVAAASLLAEFVDSTIMEARRESCS